MIKILSLIPKIIDKIRKTETLNELKSLKGSKIHKSFKLGNHTFLRLSNDANIIIEEGVEMKDYNAIRIIQGGTVKLGKNVDFNNFCSINCVNSIEIGDDSAFAEGCKIYDHDHAFVTTPVYEWKKNEFNSAPVIIGKNVKIYSDVTILKGVTIGDNCIIGAKCIINKNIPANSIIFLKGDFLKLPLA